MPVSSLTAEFLAALSIPADAAEAILSAHAAAISALTAERDQLLEDRTIAEDAAVRAKAELDQYKADQTAAEKAAAIGRAVRAALLAAGANPQVVPLLEKEIPQDQIILDGETLVNASELIAPLKDRYPDLFARVERIPAASIDVPAAPEAITRADLSSMSAEDINRNWPQVRASLSQF